MDDPSYGTKMKDAIKYSLNQECYLRQFLNDGNIPIDNGAIIYSLIETARARGANARYFFSKLW